MKQSPSLNFHIDYQEDLRYVLRRIRGLEKYDPPGLEYRVEQKNLDMAVIKKILAQQNGEEQLDILDGYLSQFYRENLGVMESVSNQYQEIWDGIQGEYLDKLTSLTGNLPWHHTQYEFLVGSFFSRSTWGKDNKLAIWWRRDPQKHYPLVAYELTEARFWETVNDLYGEKPVSGWHLWALSEILAFIFNFTVDEIVDEFWPARKPENPTSAFQTSSYPQLAEPYREIYGLYQNAIDYETFLNDAVGKIASYSEDELTKSR